MNANSNRYFSLALMVSLLLGWLPVFKVSGADVQIVFAESHDVKLSRQGDVLNVETTGQDPFLVFNLANIKPKDSVLEMEYFAVAGIQRVQLFLGPPFSEDSQQWLPDISPAEAWVTYAADINDALAKRLLNRPLKLRLDLGAEPNVKCQIRSLKLRPRSAKERKAKLGERKKNAWCSRKPRS